MILRKAQRLDLRSPPGTLLKGGNARLPRPRAIDGGRDEAYLKLIRQCPCLKCGLDGFSEAAHVRMGSGFHRKASAGMGRKPPDRFTVPLCSGCHTRDSDSLHKTGEALFWRRLGIDPHLTCSRFDACNGDLVAMRAMAFVVISERGKTGGSDGQI